jgi:hypothetical protein
VKKLPKERRKKHSLSKPETKLVHKITKALEETFPGSYFRKIYGSPFQHAGMTDLIGCVEGFFVGLEVKTTEGHVSEIQKLEGLSIVRANGIYGVVTSPEEAIEVINLSINSIKGK